MNGGELAATCIYFAFKWSHYSTDIKSDKNVDWWTYLSENLTEEKLQVNVARYVKAIKDSPAKIKPSKSQMLKYEQESKVGQIRYNIFWLIGRNLAGNRFIIDLVSLQKCHQKPNQNCLQPILSQVHHRKWCKNWKRMTASSNSVSEIKIFGQSSVMMRKNTVKVRIIWSILSPHFSLSRSMNCTQKNLKLNRDLWRSCLSRTTTPHPLRFS